MTTLSLLLDGDDRTGRGRDGINGGLDGLVAGGNIGDRDGPGRWCGTARLGYWMLTSGPDGVWTPLMVAVRGWSPEGEAGTVTLIW